MNKKTKETGVVVFKKIMKILFIAREASMK